MHLAGHHGQAVARNLDLTDSTQEEVGTMAFDDETIDVLIGGYLSKDAAMEDYESVLGCGGYLHGAVVVTKRPRG